MNCIRDAFIGQEKDKPVNYLLTITKIYRYTNHDMPRSSRASLTDETIQELENQFYDFLSSLNPDERRKFFSEFLTNEEKMMMYKRLALYWCLLEGYSLAKIQQMIGVTHDTTRVYNKKKNMLSDEFKTLLSRIAKEDVSDENKNEEKKAEDATPGEETPMETESEDTHTDVPEGVNIDINQPIETREIEKEEVKIEMESVITDTFEPMSEEQKESSENEMPELKADEEKMGEEVNSVEEAGEKEESSGLTPNEPQNEEDNKSDESEDGDGKKKSGLAKFFGF